MHSVCMKLFLVFLLSSGLLNGVYAADESKFKHSEEVFNFAEQKYPQYFSPSGIKTTEIGDYWARYYPEKDIYIGTQGDEVFIHGKVFGGLLHVGNIASLRPLGECAHNIVKAVCTSMTYFSTGSTESKFVPNGNCSSSFPQYVIDLKLSKASESKCQAGAIPCGACALDSK